MVFIHELPFIVTCSDNISNLVMWLMFIIYVRPQRRSMYRQRKPIHTNRLRPYWLCCSHVHSCRFIEVRDERTGVRSSCTCPFRCVMYFIKTHLLCPLLSNRVLLEIRPAVLYIRPSYRRSHSLRVPIHLPF